MEASIDHRELRGPKEKCCCGWPAAMAEYWGSAFVSIRPNGRSATGTQLPACSAAERGPLLGRRIMAGRDEECLMCWHA